MTQENSSSPAIDIPAPDPARPFVPLVYFMGKSLFDLSSGDFYRFLGDFPKALLWKLRLENISSDDNFYYCHESRFEEDWAFAKAPADNFFEPHPIWSRRAGQDWQLADPAGTLAAPR